MNSNGSVVISSPKCPCDPPARGRIVAALLLAVVLILACVAAYHNSFTGAFVFDDITSILENPTIRGPMTESLQRHGIGYTVQNRPVVNFTLAVNYRLGGENPCGYHAMNLLMHLLAAMLLYGVIRRTLLLPCFGGRFSPSVAAALATAAAVLWAVHPLQTDAVTYVIQRCETLMGMFFLLTLYCSIRGVGAGRQRLWLAAAAVSCMLGAGCKEVMATAPIVIVLYDWIFVERSLRNLLRRRWLFYAALFSSWILLAALVFPQGARSTSAGFGMGMGVWEYARTQFGVILHYLRLSFWPDVLIIDYGYDLASGFWQIVPQAIGIGLLLMATAAALRWRPAWGFLGVWFFVILAPSSSIIPLVSQTAAEKRMYLPLAAVAVLTTVGIYLLGAAALRRLVRDDRRRARVGWAIGLLVVLAAAMPLAWRTMLRNDDYRSPLVLWQTTAEHRPGNSRAHQSLGQYLLKAGDVRGAMEELNKAIDLSPCDPRMYVDRSVVNCRSRRYALAISDCTSALQLDANLVQAYINRGDARIQMGQAELAVDDLSAAIRLKPRSADAYSLRAAANRNLGRLPEALADANAAIDLDPRLAKAYVNRGNILHQLGQSEQALADYSRALAIQPDLAEAHSLSSVVLRRMGQYDRALAECEKAIKLTPSLPEAYLNRGAVYDVTGRYDQAIADDTRAIELDEDYAVAYHNRAVAYFHKRDYDRAWRDLQMCRRLGYPPNPEFLRQLIEASGRQE